MSGTESMMSTRTQLRFVSAARKLTPPCSGAAPQLTGAEDSGDISCLGFNGTMQSSAVS